MGDKIKGKETWDTRSWSREESINHPLFKYINTLLGQTEKLTTRQIYENLFNVQGNIKKYKNERL